MATQENSDSKSRVEAALARLGKAFEIREFPESTRTSQEAADAVGCEVGQIAKSLIFKTRESDQPVLVVASGANRVDEAAVGRILGEKIARADAGFVRERTGFAIGGVAPVGHLSEPIVLLDKDLLRYEAIWAAAGTPNRVFELSPDDLVVLTDGKFCDIKKN